MPIETFLEGNLEHTKWHCTCETVIDLSLPKNDPNRVQTWQCDNCSKLDSEQSEDDAYFNEGDDEQFPPEYRNDDMTADVTKLEIPELEYQLDKLTLAGQESDRFTDITRELDRRYKEAEDADKYFDEEMSKQSMRYERKHLTPEYYDTALQHASQFFRGMEK